MSEIEELKAENQRLTTELQYIQAVAWNTGLNSDSNAYPAALLDILVHAQLALNPPSGYQPSDIPARRDAKESQC